MLKSIVKQFRKVLGRLREKPNVRIDDHEFEHLSLYHGLVGSSPENQRSFRDVRADVMDAVKAGSSLQLGIALKLQPLLWQDKLDKIFAEVAEQSEERLVAVLLPEREGEPWPDTSDPLGHSDWRVRSNAAFAAGFLGITRAKEKLIRCLHDTASSASPAYPHISMSLAKLGGDDTIKALLEHLNDAEPWFRIDTAAALAQFQDAQVKDVLEQSLLTINPLSDYLAVVLSKRFHALDLMEEKTILARRAGFQLISGLTDAANQTFTADILQTLDLEEAAKKLGALDPALTDVFALRAMFGIVALWRDKQDSLDVTDPATMQVEIDRLKLILNGENSRETIVETLANYVKNGQNSSDVELLDAIQLVGKLQIESALPQLLQLLQLLEFEEAIREDIVYAIGTTGDASAAPRLIALATSQYKIEERTRPSISSMPVVEEDPGKSRLYWKILQALGNLPSRATNDYLFAVASDYAPDKRQQVLESLYELHKSFSADENLKFEELVKSGLEDPAATVKASALKGVGALNAVHHLDRVLKMADSQEPSISRQALATLGQLARSGNETVVKAIKTKLEAEKDEKRKRRLAAVIRVER